MPCATSSEDSVTAKIAAQRKTVRELYDTALAAIERQSFANKAMLLEDLRARIAKAEAARQLADAAIRLSRDQRDESLRKSFAPTMTAMVDGSLALWYAVVYTTASGDSELAQLAVIKEIGWKMREFSGLARAAVANAIQAARKGTTKTVAAFASASCRGPFYSRSQPRR